MTILLLAAALAGVQDRPATAPQMWTAWCAPCHAEDGTGRVTAPTITVAPMDFTDCKVAAAEPDADWERAIAKGGAAVGLSAEMPGFEDSITPREIALFVTHLRSFCTDPGWPNGNANFPRPIVTGKAFPENEVVLLPAISHFSEPTAAPSITDAALKAVYERRLGKRSMIEVGVPFVSTNSLLTRTAGIGDISVGVKYVLHARGARIVSAGLQAVLPSGARFKDHGAGTAVVEPSLSAGAMLRGWYVQSQVKGALSTNTIRARHHVLYNGYVGRDTGGAPNTWTLGVELNGMDDTLAITPQVRKGLTATGAVAASAGVMVPINKREQQGVRWVGYLLWEYLEPWRARN